MPEPHTLGLSLCLPGRNNVLHPKKCTSSADPLFSREWCWLCEDSLKELDCSAPQLREYGKKHGPAREARDHCQAVHEAHRGGPTM